MDFIYSSDFGKLLLRLTVGFLMLMHGYSKIVNGVGFIEGVVVDAGLPAFVAYGVYIGEVLAPILLILGVQVRFSALVIAFTMLSAIVLVHMDEIFTMTRKGWAIELPMFFLLTSLSIFFLGAGKYKVSNS